MPIECGYKTKLSGVPREGADLFGFALLNTGELVGEGLKVDNRREIAQGYHLMFCLLREIQIVDDKCHTW